jgi:hypothetical protein
LREFGLGGVAEGDGHDFCFAEEKTIESHLSAGLWEMSRLENNTGHR